MEESCGPAVVVAGLVIQGECRVIEASDCECPDENICPNFAVECDVATGDFLYCCCYPTRAPDVCYDDVVKSPEVARKQTRKNRKHRRWHNKN